MNWEIRICSTSTNYERVLKVFDCEEKADELLKIYNNRLKENNWKACFYKKALEKTNE
jgi:hypothetical protein